MNIEQKMAMQMLLELLHDEVFYKDFAPILIKVNQTVQTSIYESEIEAKYFIGCQKYFKHQPKESIFRIGKDSSQHITLSNLEYVTDKKDIMNILSDELSSCVLLETRIKDEQLRSVAINRHSSISSNLQLQIFFTIHKGLSLDLVKKHLYNNYEKEDESSSSWQVLNRILNDPEKLQACLDVHTREKFVDFVIENMKQTYHTKKNYFSYLKIDESNRLVHSSKFSKHYNFYLNPEYLEDSQINVKNHFLEILQKKEFNFTPEELSHLTKELIINAIELEQQGKPGPGFTFNETTLPYLKLLKPKDLNIIFQKLNSDPEDSAKGDKFFKTLMGIQNINNESHDIESITMLSKKINPYQIYIELKSSMSISFYNKNEPLFESQTFRSSENKDQRFLEGLKIYFQNAQKAINEVLSISEDEIPGNALNMKKDDHLASIRLFFNKKISEKQMENFLNLIIANINETTLTNVLDTKEAITATFRADLMEARMKELPINPESSTPDTFKL